jgi:hypothetical protein
MMDVFQGAYNSNPPKSSTSITPVWKLRAPAAKLAAACFSFVDAYGVGPNLAETT